MFEPVWAEVREEIIEAQILKKSCKDVIPLYRCRLTCNLACEANGTKSSQALEGTLSLWQTSSLVTRPLLLSLQFCFSIWEKKNAHHTDTDTLADKMTTTLLPKSVLSSKVCVQTRTTYSRGILRKEKSNLEMFIILLRGGTLDWSNMLFSRILKRGEIMDHTMHLEQRNSEPVCNPLIKVRRKCLSSSGTFSPPFCT